MSVIRRDDTYYLKKRVPVRYASVEQRKLIWITLKTDSEKAAKTKAGAVWNEVVGSWEALINGIIDDAEVQYTAAKQIAVSRGSVSYTHLDVYKRQDHQRHRRCDRQGECAGRRLWPEFGLQHQDAGSFARIAGRGQGHHAIGQVDRTQTKFLVDRTLT